MKIHFRHNLLLLVLVSCAVNVAFSIKSSPLSALEDMKNSSPESLFRTFISVYKKEYSINSPIGQQKFQIFKKNLQNIDKYNKECESSRTTFGFNPYMDITEKEFFGADYVEPKSIIGEITPKIKQNPFQPIDWRQTIPFSKRPGWGQDGFIHMAFNILFSYEAAQFIKTNNYVELSAKQFVNCINVNSPYVYAYEKGILAEKDYPVGQDWWKLKEPCNADNINANRHIFESNAVSGLLGAPEHPAVSRSVSDLYAYLLQGPVQVRVAASWDKLTNYSGGIFESDKPCVSCRECYRSFNALLVGYGVDSNTRKEFWILKFYRGNDWGENGYMRLLRNDSALNYGLSCWWELPIA